ncbi:MAG: serine hydrolase domain-containing protein [Gemmatimonadota bacterium]|nr:serine hydrolase domain-containing protein [Gemmatimonadota bacterium]
MIRFRMVPDSWRRSCAILTLFLVATQPAAGQGTTLTPAQLARIDSAFVQYQRPESPGCALGVSRNDQMVLEQAWGHAELEYSIPISPATIFEGGSVSKQFTAAAVLLLAQEGKLSLDDNLRRWVPEIPDYGTPITIRHLLNHTSGLKDWGSIAGIGGWPRGSRIYTHAHVLEILGRQGSLNYTPGAEYLYSNSNYNLLAIIAERVSGESLPALTKRLIFDPLGMTHTSWRDDFTRIVPGRAQAYARAADGWHLEMPSENVYGNSSLLTTVGDLLKWSANTAHMRVGGQAFRAEQQRKGRLNDGSDITYAAGIQMTTYAGMPEISHTGATAGYRAFLGRYPESGWAIAILCNASNAAPGPLGHAVVDAVLGRPPTRAPSVGPSATLTIAPVQAAALREFAGHYRSIEADVTLEAAVQEGRLVLLGTPSRRMVLTAGGADQFNAGGNGIVFTRNPAGAVDGMLFTVDRARKVKFERVEGSGGPSQ